MGLLNVYLVTFVQLSLCLRVLAQASIVDLGYAQYQGAVDTSLSITNFLGMRYAAAPVGNLRWAAPQVPSTVSGVQQATSEPNECPQAGLGTSSTNPLDRKKKKKRGVSQSEDCLFLNVHVPGTTVNPVTSGGLPVVVWIHGGGYDAFAASMYDGSDLVFQSGNGVIAVVIQYRLGLFGFLPGAEVKAGGVLNAGLLDQRFALEWVQEHISKFGGDPTRVTIWGESAGAGSVLQHIVADGGNTQPPLFKYAMTSSTFLGSQYYYGDRIPELLYSEVVSGAGCSSSSDTLSCLRSASTDTLSSVNNQIESNGFYNTPTFVPVIDGTFIIERPTVTLEKGNHNGEALYAVTNVNEGFLFVQPSLTMNAQQYITTLFPNMPPGQANTLGAMYAGFGNPVDQASFVIGESLFICPSYYFLRVFGNNAWKGEFAIPPAYHGSDVQYYFTTSTSQFITAFSNSFMAMVMSGNPGNKYNSGDILPSFNNWANDDTEMIFNVTSSGSPDVYSSMTDSGLLHRCGAWMNVAGFTSQ